MPFEEIFVKQPRLELQGCLEKFWMPKAVSRILLSGYQTNMNIKLGDMNNNNDNHNDNHDNSNK